MRVAGVIFDHFDDVNNELGFDISSIPVKLLEHVKEASSPDEYALRIITRHGVVDKYPISDPLNTYISAWYFTKTASALPPDNIPAVAAKIYNAIIEQDVPITPEISEIEKVAQDGPAMLPEGPITIVEATAGPSLDELMEKQAKAYRLTKFAKKLTYQERKALPDSVFALVIKKPGGGKIRKYPLHDEAHVRNAIVRFAQHHDKLPPKYRAQVARKIKQAAKKFGIKISPDNVLNKYASVTQTDMLRKVEERIRYSTGEFKKVYEKIAEAIIEGAPMEKVAELIEKADRLSGLDKVWDIIGDPFEKTAAKQNPKRTKRPKQIAKDMVRWNLAKRLAEVADVEPDVISAMIEE